MGTNTKRRTTMAKLNRENKLREKRMEKQIRKEQRKLAPPPVESQLEDVDADADGLDAPDSE